MEELEKCPCCGHEAKIIKGIGLFNVSVKVKCGNCGLQTMEYVSGSVADAKILAVSAWNRRTGE